MTHHKNLKVLAFVGEEAAQIVEYLTGKGFPKVSLEDMPSQIEHLAQAGQHRLITHEVSTPTLFELLREAFPGEITLVAVTQPQQAVTDELAKQAHYYVENDPAQIDELLETIDFAL